MTTNPQTLQGAYSAIFTPMDSSGAVNFEMLLRIADYQVSRGIQGFFACGSTGEGLLLREHERVEVVRQLKLHLGDRARVIAHVGHPSTSVAAELAKRAADDGADWVASTAPIFYGTTPQGAMRHYEQIASATDLPFMIYALGGAMQPDRDLPFFELPNVCGLKYTGANFFSVQQLAGKLTKRVSLMSGFDEQFVAGQSFGFHGGIGSTYNFAPQFYAGIYTAYQAGEIEKAAKLQAEVNQVTALMIEYENWSYRKAIMRYIGFDCGAYRAPFAPLTEGEYQEFARRLEALSVLERKD